MIVHVELSQESGLPVSPLSSDVTTCPHSLIICRSDLYPWFSLVYFLSFFILLPALPAAVPLLVLVSVISNCCWE